MKKQLDTPAPVCDDACAMTDSTQSLPPSVDLDRPGHCHRTRGRGSSDLIRTPESFEEYLMLSVDEKLAIWRQSREPHAD